MEGLYFEIENKKSNFIYNILNGVYSSDFIWKISEDEIYKNNTGDAFPFATPLFEQEIYDNESFFKTLKKENYAIFCNIQLYKKGDNISYISNVEDFLNSDCKLIFLLTDDCFVEIYCKEKEIMNIIKKNVSNIGITQYINKDIHSRKTMFARGD